MDMGLQRFLNAQEEAYPRALQEIRQGRKTSHWMWYIFPQIRGLGHSFDANYYGIRNAREAEQYLSHPVLGQRLEEITLALLELPERDPQNIFGYIDSLKLRSSMTLFYYAGHAPLYERVLEEFYGSVQDELTLQILKKEEQ